MSRRSAPASAPNNSSAGRNTAARTPSEAESLLAAAVAALPELQRQGVRRLVVGGLVLELDRVEPPYVGEDTDASPRARSDASDDTHGGMPPHPPPGESDDLDTAAVE